MDDVVLHWPAETVRVSGRDPGAVDLDVAAVKEDIDGPQAVLLAEPEAAEAGDPDLGPEQRQPRQPWVGPVRAADRIGSASHGSNLSSLWAQARIDVVHGGPVQHRRSPDLQAVERIDRPVQLAEPPGGLPHRRHRTTQVFLPASGVKSL